MGGGVGKRGNAWRVSDRIGAGAEGRSMLIQLGFSPFDSMITIQTLTGLTVRQFSFVQMLYGELFVDVVLLL